MLYKNLTIYICVMTKRWLFYLLTPFSSKHSQTANSNVTKQISNNLKINHKTFLLVNLLQERNKVLQ